MRSYFLTLALLIASLVCSPAMAQDRLDGSAIQGKIVGNTITIVTQNLERATGLVESSGEIRGKIGDDAFEGKWFIKNDNELCFDLPENTFDICRVAVEVGDSAINLFTTTGEPRGRVEVMQGNPNNF